MFDLKFLPDRPVHVDEEGWRGRWGLVVLGDFKEMFVSPTRWWKPADYQRQWTLGARRLLTGEANTAFAIEAGRLWWVAWRVGNDVVFQQRLLVAREMAPAWTAAADALPHDLVGERVTQNEDGDTISE